MDKAKRLRSRKASRPKGLQIKQRHGRWHVVGVVRVGDKRLRVRRSLGISSKRPASEAEEAARAAEGLIVQELLHGKSQVATFAHACARYLKDRRRGKDDDWKDPEAPTVRKLAEAIRHTRLRDVTSPVLQGVLTKMWGHTSQANQARVCSTIGGIFSAALRHGLVDAKPHVPRPKGTAKPAPVNKWLYPEEISILLDCLPEHLRLPIKMMFFQGRRPSEILYRDWADVDWRPGRERLDLGRTKTGKTESVPLDAEIVDDLKALASQRRADGYQLTGAIFLTMRGEPWTNPQNRHGLPIDKPVRIAREKAASVLEDMATQETDIDRRAQMRERADVMRQVTAYWGRHNFVSHHVASKTTPLAIAEMVGWSSLDMLNRYGHLSDEHLRDEMSRVRITGKKGQMS